MKAKKTKLILAAILVIVAGVLLITCPGRRAHREALIDAIGNDLASSVGINIRGDAIKSIKEVNYNFYNAAVNPCLKVMGYGLFSIGYINDGKNPQQRISFGILGHVFIKEKEHIHRKFPLLAEPIPVAPQKEDTKD
ncbi:MAG: hypothetical protein II157_06140 [Bacteroidales bacterium]|nr:hypothetical protein [Bacteroidales bacterium]